MRVNYSARTWAILWSLALVVRLSAAFLLPTAEQDGYSYAEAIARLSANLGHLQWKDLFGFWLPLFQLTAALLNIWIDNALLAGKILSALCGATSCVLVFALTKKLTENLTLACVTFALILCNPLHILYSAASMTEIPHSCLVLASLWFLLKERWLGAAIFAALAGSVRIEAWALIPLLPLLQFFRQRRVSLIVIGILLLPPLAWLGICQLATGDPFAYFADRVRYHEHYMDFYPTRRGFAFADISVDLDYFLLGANGTAFLAIIVAGGLSILQAIRDPHRLFWPAAAVAAYAFAMLGLLLFAYVTKRQPVILPRYGLTFFPLGLPLVGWLIQLLLNLLKPRVLATYAAVAIVVLSLRSWHQQLPVIFKVLDDFRAHQQVSQAVAAALGQTRDDNSRCFSDDVAVRVLSRLPPGRFTRSAIAPLSAWQSAADFQSFLRQQNVAYLVFTRIEDSLPAKFYPELGRKPESDAGDFEFVTMAASSFGPDVWLYRLRDQSP